ncbi:MAG: ribonuclease PH [Candidatus Dadabacteria bacterium]|nr:MAG: ribonuclease PH [Candidatus Dadabacteria bacterium]
MVRIDGRKPDELRPVTIERDFIIYPEGSVLISCGNTRVLCNASVEEGVPGWIERDGLPGGWITADYSMLPRSTEIRNKREVSGQRGRTQEIKRLIGRSLRAGFNLEKLGPRTITVDCDVLQADGGTRTASITGGYIATAIAINRLISAGEIDKSCILSEVAAVSVGIVEGEALLDLCYAEDSAAECDVNIVMNTNGEFIEIQGTAEKAPFNSSELTRLIEIATKGIKELIEIQKGYLSL